METGKLVQNEHRLITIKTTMLLGTHQKGVPVALTERTPRQEPMMDAMMIHGEDCKLKVLSLQRFVLRSAEVNSIAACRGQILVFQKFGQRQLFDSWPPLRRALTSMKVLRDVIQSVYRLQHHSTSGCPHSLLQVSCQLGLQKCLH